MKFLDKETGKELYATQVKEGNEEDILSFMQETNLQFEATGYYQMKLHLESDDLEVKPGEWIIQETSGFSVMSDEEFPKFFEEL